MKRIYETVKKQADKWSFYGWLLIFGCSMIPLLYLSRFIVPGCDDYSYGVLTHGAWLDTHSLLQVLKAAAKTTADYWHKWQGTYSSIFLMTLSPGILDEKWYFLTPFIISGMLIGGITVLLRTILTKYIWTQTENSNKKYQTGICILVILFLVFQTMVSAADGLYWYNGALHYVVMESVLFFQISVLLLFLKEKQKIKNVLFLILAVFFAFVLGGANLLTGLQALILEVLIILYCFWQNITEEKKRPSGRTLLLLLPFAVNLAGFACNILAPGNMIREGTAEGMGAVSAVIMSFYWGAVFVFEWTTPIVIFGFILLVPVVWKMTEHAQNRFFKPVWVLILSYCVFSAMFTPTLYATSSEGPDRCKNVMRVVLYLLVFLNMVNTFGWFAHKHKDGMLCVLQKEAAKRYLAWILVFTCLVGGSFLLAANKNTYTSVSALRSVLNGEAAQYYAENAERLQIYNDESIQDMTVSYLTAKPYLLFKADVGNEGSQDYWINLFIVEYYRKNSLTVK